MKLLNLLALLLTISTVHSEVYLGRLKRDSDRAEIHAKAHGKAKHLRHVDIERLELTEEEANELLASGKFEFLEPDQEIQLDAVPNDPLYGQLWGMANIQAPLAWDITTGSDDVVVAVVDSGLWAEHPDLIANVWTDPITGAHGWSCRNGVITEGVIDDNGHGTHCAGTIAATGNNGIGVSGVSWSTKVAGFKFLTATGGGWASDAVMLYDKIIELKKSGRGNFRITSNSFGGSGSVIGGNTYMTAFARLEAEGILSCVAAGNAGTNIDVRPYWPACATNDGVITVQAHNSANITASFSNYGQTNTDLSAPGVSILSTCLISGGKITNSTGYKAINGTSMACPHVAGVAALALSVYPELTPSELKDLLMDSTDQMTGIGAQSVTGGRINAYKVVKDFIPTPPPPSCLLVSPSGLSATKTSTGYRVRWGDTSTGEANYAVRVTSKEKSVTRTEGTFTLPSNTTTYSFTKALRPRTTYTFSVWAAGCGTTGPVATVSVRNK